MTKNTIKNINARIDQICADRESEIIELAKKLEDAQTAVASARNLMETSTASADNEAYHAAKEAEKKALISVELYTNRLDQLKGARLVSMAEDARVVAEIRAYQQDLEEDVSKKIIALLSQIEQIGRDYYTAQDDADATLSRWHRQVCRQINPTTKQPYRPHQCLRYKDDDLRSCIKQIATLYYYRNQIGREQYHGMGSFWN